MTTPEEHDHPPRQRSEHDHARGARPQHDHYSVVVELRPRVNAGPEQHPPVFETIEGWPRTLEGVITATTRAAWLSLRHGPHEVWRGDDRLLARFVGGRRADLGSAVHKTARHM